MAGLGASIGSASGLFISLSIGAFIECSWCVDFKKALPESLIVLSPQGDETPRHGRSSFRVDPLMRPDGVANVARGCCSNRGGARSNSQFLTIPTDILSNLVDSLYGLSRSRINDDVLCPEREYLLRIAFRDRLAPRLTGSGQVLVWSSLGGTAVQPASAIRNTPTSIGT